VEEVLELLLVHLHQIQVVIQFLQDHQLLHQQGVEQVDLQVVEQVLMVVQAEVQEVMVVMLVLVVQVILLP
tara:strand:+ start:148 stop:360 length:213 start_codon:yes stop_codon:yes gene_type:complete